MKLRILGCSGGIGGDLRTTSMLLDQDVLIDAGTGVGDLSVAELAQIDHIFVTHSHMDHVASIPFIADTVGPKVVPFIAGFKYLRQVLRFIPCLQAEVYTFFSRLILIPLCVEISLAK